MNKKLIALAVAGASVSSLASAATIYSDEDSSLEIGGRIEVRGHYSDANKIASDDNRYEDTSRARINLGGKHQFNDDIAFIGFTEAELTENSAKTNDDLQLNTRYLYAGVESKKFGSLTYGHQDTAFTYLTNWTDMAENWSGYVNEYNAATADRADNVLRYAYQNDKFTFQTHIQADSNSDGAAPTDGGASNYSNDADGYGIIAAYKLTDNLELGAGWAAVDGNASGDDAAIDNGKNQTYLVAAKYTNNGVWAAMTYSGGVVSTNAQNEDNFNAVDAYLGYTFDDNNINMTYNYYNVDEENAQDTLKDYNVNNIGIEYARKFGDATVYGAYQFNLLDENDVISTNTDDHIQVGLRYAF